MDMDGRRLGLWVKSEMVDLQCYPVIWEHFDDRYNKHSLTVIAVYARKDLATKAVRRLRAREKKERAKLGRGPGTKYPVYAVYWVDWPKPLVVERN